MNTQIHLSLNQLAEFSIGTETRKKRIIEQQLNPKKFLLSWYQLAKGGMKKYFINVNDIKPILSTIDRVLKKPDEGKKRKQIDKQVSLEALRRLMEMKIPEILKSTKYEIIKPKEKTVDVFGVNIIVAPEIIIKAEIQSKIVYGAIKFHITKTKPFTNEQASLATCVIYEYLKTQVAGKGEIVIPELCFSLDVFGKGLVHAPLNRVIPMKNLKSICAEIVRLWTAA